MFFVVGESVGVEAFADGGVSGSALFVLVEDPFESGAAAEAVFPCGVWDAGKNGLVVEAYGAAFFVSAEAGFAGW